MPHLMMRLLAVALLSGSLAAAVPASAEDTVDVVLSRLPAARSAGYADLKRLSRAVALTKLPMTRAETWRLPASRLAALKAAAEPLGTTVMPLDATWNHVLTPMPSKPPMTAGQETMMHDTMRQPPVMGMTMMALPPPEILEHALTKDMARPEQDVRASLVIKLTDQLAVTAVRTSVRKTGAGYAWHGAIEGSDEPVTLIWWADGRLSGNITYQGHVYSVRSFGGGMHGVIEVAPAKLPPEHAPMSKQEMQDMGMQRDPLVEQGAASMLRKLEKDTGNRQDADHSQRIAAVPPGDLSLGRPRKHAARAVTISVLVAYTKAAARFYDDIGRDLIALAIEDANQSYRNSGIGQVSLELVHAYETPYVESGSHFNHVFRFADRNDGVMDEVHALRDQYRADVAVLIVDDPKGCGLAAEIHAPPERAFAVIDQACAATSYSLAHEIGHLIGARHDVALDENTKPFPYGHGFVRGTEWRTMMSYKESCGGCPRIPVWSNPAISIRGVPAGDALSDNARVIAEQAARVAAFR